MCIIHPFQWKLLLAVGDWRVQLWAHCWQKAWQTPDYLQSHLSFFAEGQQGYSFYLSFLAETFQHVSRTHWQELCIPVNFISLIGLPVSQPVDFLGRMCGSSVFSGPCLRTWWWTCLVYPGGDSALSWHRSTRHLFYLQISNGSQRLSGHI